MLHIKGVTDWEKYTHESARGYLLIVLDLLPIGNVADGEDGFGGFEISIHN